MKYSSSIILTLVLIILILPTPAVLPGQNLPATGSQIYFEDFIGSQFPIGWSAEIFSMMQNATQTNGYFVTTVSRASSFSSTSGQVLAFWANNTGTPVFAPPLGTSIQFRQIVFKMKPFNLTNVVATKAGGAVAVKMDVQIGIAASAGGGYLAIPSPGAVFFDLIGSNRPLANSLATLPTSNQAILLGINKPMASATNSYYDGNFPGTNSWLLYDKGTIDLSAMHVFTIQMETDQTNATNTWVRWQVDSNGWMQLLQTGCNCITGPTGEIRTLFPFITTSYFVDAGPPITVSQSLGSYLDYVLATDYVPASLPSGQLLSSNINPPTRNQGIYQPEGFSLTQYIQFQAWELGQGNIYAGGLFLTGIFLLIITAGLGGVFFKLKLGISIFGMIWNISTLAFVYLMFFTGVLPLIIPILVSIGAAAIFFGIFRSGPPASGGEITG